LAWVTVYVAVALGDTLYWLVTFPLLLAFTPPGWAWLTLAAVCTAALARRRRRR
jgi:MYXO-CTERM domain-containing protein